MAKQRFVCIVQVQLSTDSRCHIIDKDQFVIGRVPGVDLLLPSTRLSRHHVAVSVNESEITITDLDSSNGTFVNGARIEPKRPYSLPFNTPFQLAGPQISVIINIIDRPLELEDHQTVMKKFNQEASLWFEKVNFELQGQAQQILDSARAKGQEMANQVLAEAQAESEQILKEASTVSQAEKEKIRDDIRAQVEKETEQIYQKAKAEAEGLRQQALSMAKAESKLLLEEEIKKVQLETKQQCAEIKQIAQTEADQLIEATNRRVVEVKNESEKEIRELLIQAQKESKEILQEAHKKSDAILEEARNSSKKTRDEAQKNYEQITASARRVAAETIEKQQKESLATQNEIIKEAKERAAKAASIILEDAKHKSLEMITQAENEKSKLEENIGYLKKESEDLEEKRKELSDLESRKTAFLREIEKIEDNFSRMKSHEQEVIQLISDRKKIEKSKSDLEKKMNELQEEFSGARQKNLVEHDLLKKKQQDELHSMKVQALNELAMVTQEEEKKFLSYMTMQKVELAKHIEISLIPDLAKTLGVGQLSPEQVSAIGGKISSAVHIATARQEPLNWDTKRMAADSGKKFMTSFKTSKTARYATISMALILVGLIFTYVQPLDQPAQQKNYAEKVIEKRQQESTFAPVQTDNFRDTYVDNIIYLRNYTDIKLDPQIQDRWALELNDFFFNELRLGEDMMVKFVGMETALVKRLVQLRASIDAKYLDEGLERMRAQEETELVKIKEILQNPKNYKKLRLREKAFVQKESLNKQRQPAADTHAPAVKNNDKLDFDNE